MKDNKQLSIGAILSYINILVGAVVTIFYTPLMIRMLGQSEYGLYNTVSSIIASLSILSFGFNSSYIRFYSRYKAEKQQEKISSLNGMFLIIFLVIGFISLLCGLYIANNLHIVFNQGLSIVELKIAKKLMLLLSINLALSFPASVFTSIITAHEEFIFQKTLNLLKHIVSPLINIPLLLMGGTSVELVICSVCINILIEIINIYFCFGRLHIKVRIGFFDIKLFKEMAGYSIFIAINMIVDQINLNLDKIILGRFCGTDSVAVYSVGYSLYNYYHTFSTSISNVFIPKVHHIWNKIGVLEEEKDKQLSELFAKVGGIQFIVMFLLCSGLIFFGRQFIGLWVGGEYENAYYVFILLATSAIVPLTQNVGIEIQRAKNKHRFRSGLYAIMAAINVLISVYLCQICGEVGAAIGTAISFLIANALIMNIYYYKVLKINVKIYWKCCKRIVLGVSPACIAGVALCYIFDTFNWKGMILGIVIYVCSYIISLYFFVLEEEEKKILKKFMTRK